MLLNVVKSYLFIPEYMYFNVLYLYCCIRTFFFFKSNAMNVRFLSDVILLFRNLWNKMTQNQPVTYWHTISGTK